MHCAFLDWALAAFSGDVAVDELFSVRQEIDVFESGLKPLLLILAALALIGINATVGCGGVRDRACAPYSPGGTGRARRGGGQERDRCRRWHQ